MPSSDHFAVAIVGSGPTGLTLANLLGRAGIQALLIERNFVTVTEPRAVSIDDESLRTMQAAGVIDAVIAEIVPGYGSHYHSPGGWCFAKVEPSGTPFGYPRRNAFRQPVLERQLCDNLQHCPSVQTRFGWRMLGFEDNAQSVRLALSGPNGADHAVSCDYLVGCDGASSLVRDRLGLTLGGTTFDERWLIIDLENSRNDVRHTKVFCDVRRPCITLPGPHQTRRYEFKLLPGEADSDMLDEGNVAELLRTHDADPAATIRRKVVYHFHARVADRWSRGRVFLAGDAAHLTPPFAGQGMNSGIRDAHNLAWKLASVVSGMAGPGLLNSYAEERRPHVWAMIRLALRMGRIMAPPSRLQGALTRAMFTALRVWPPARDYVLQMKYKPKPRFSSGFVLRNGTAPGLVGRLFPQPTVIQANGTRLLLDEVLGGSFSLLAYGAPSAAIQQALAHRVWDALNTKRVVIRPPGGAVDIVIDGMTIVHATEDAAAVFAPHEDVILLLRPDRYVLTAFRPADADAAAHAVQALIESTWPAPASKPRAAPAEVHPHATASANKSG